MDDRKGKENPSYMKNRKDKRGQMAPLYGLTGGQVITTIANYSSHLVVTHFPTTSHLALLLNPTLGSNNDSIIEFG